MADDGQVRIGIYVDQTSVKQSMDEAVSTVKQGTQEMSTAADKAGKDIGNAVSKGFDPSKLQQQFKSVQAQVAGFAKTIAASAASLGVWVMTTAKYADRIDEQSQLLGLSAKGYQELEFAADRAGLKMETFRTVMQKLNVAVASGGESLAELGVNIYDVNGQLKTQEQLLFETLTALSEMPDSVEKTSIGIKVLGESFQKMTPLLNTGAGGFNNLRKTFEELGIAIDSKTLGAFADFMDTVGDLGYVIKKTFVNTIKDSIPQLTKLADEIKASLQPGGDLYNMFERLAQIITAFVTDVVPPLLDFFAWIIDNAHAVATGITLIVVALKALSGNWIGAIVSGLTGLVFMMATLEDQSVDTKKALEDLKKVGLTTTNGSGKSSQAYKDLAAAKADLEYKKRELKAQQDLVAAYERGEDPIRGMSMSLEEGSKKAIEARAALKDYEDAVKSAELAVVALESANKKTASAVGEANKGLLETKLEALNADTGDFASGWDGILEAADAVKLKFAELGQNFKSQFADIVVQGLLSMTEGFDSFGQALVNGQNPLKALAQTMITTIADMISALGNLMYVRAFADYPNIDYSQLAYGTTFKVLAGVIKALASKIQGSYAEGGIIGGASYSGDRLLARVNSGEMILNTAQQRRLFDIANGASTQGRVSSNIQIINNAGADVSAEQSLDGRSIRIMVEKITENMLKGAKGSRLMGNTFGIRQLGRR